MPENGGCRGPEPTPWGAMHNVGERWEGWTQASCHIAGLSERSFEPPQGLGLQCSQLDLEEPLPEQLIWHIQSYLPGGIPTVSIVMTVHRWLQYHP